MGIREINRSLGGGGEMMDRFYKMMKRDNKGFTLVELMVVLLILGILVAIAVPIYNKTQDTAKKNTCFANQRTIEGAAAQFRAESPTGEWPEAISGTEGKDLRDYIQNPGALKCPKTEQSYTLDENGKVTCTEHGHYLDE
jgi:prepilin-type N-terminal cleavage/methylation domain-containing protein